MAKLILIRHGETETNKEWKLHKDDDPGVLTEKGKKQISLAARAIKKFSPAIVYASKEKRAQQSGKILSEILNIPFKTIADMQERNWGDFSGKTWPEVRAVLDPMSLEQRYHYVPPNGESWKDCEDRLIRAVKTALEKNKGKAVVIVSHGRSIRILMPYLLNKPIQETFKHDPPNACISVLGHENEKFKKILLEDTSHLE